MNSREKKREKNVFFEIDEKRYAITSDAFNSVYEALMLMGVQMYQEQTTTKQLAAKMFARKMLSEMENKAPDLREMIRPKRGEDPVIHMATLWASLLKQAIMESNASIVLQSETTEQGCPTGITSILFQPESAGKGGGQLVNLGKERIRKNYLRKNASHAIEPTIS